MHNDFVLYTDVSSCTQITRATHNIQSNVRSYFHHILFIHMYKFVLKYLLVLIWDEKLQKASVNRMIA